MHENREISWTSWLVQQDRSAKAINRTADMHVQEKSDCAIVPLKRPNKEGQPSAEVGEGRAQTEENIVSARMPPTQSGIKHVTGVDGVRQASALPLFFLRKSRMRNVASRIMWGPAWNPTVVNSAVPVDAT